MRDQFALLTCGPVEHGISRFGRDLAEAIREQGFTGAVLHEPDPHRVNSVLDRLPQDVGLVHLQANDWLFTDSVHRADQAIRSLSMRLGERGARLSLTLHDLPHSSVSNELFLRRARTYAAIMAEAATVIVCSDHERLLINEAAAALRVADEPGAGAMELPVVTVIPLPIPDRPAPRRRDRRPAAGLPSGITVGILGYLYPGKGHREVLEELTGLAPRMTLVAIGKPSDGHGAMVPELEALGRDHGVDFIRTGFVPDDELTPYLQNVSVPIAPAPQVSASASINSWLAAGRRPLVMAGRYAQELDDRMPGAITTYHPGGLRAQVEAALTDPSSTYLPRTFRPDPDRHEVAARYLHWLRSSAALSVG